MKWKLLSNLAVLSEGGGRRGPQPSCRNRYQFLPWFGYRNGFFDKSVQSVLLQFSAASNKTQQRGEPSLWERTGGVATTPGPFFLSLIFISPLSILKKITPGTRRASFRPLVFTFSFSTLFKIVKIRLTPRTGRVQGGRTSVYNGRYYYRNNVRRL